MSLKRVLLTAITVCGFSAVSVEETTIPLLNMEDYYNKETHKEFVDTLSKAFQEYGCFAVINATIDQQVIDNGYKCAESFFNESLEKKMRISGKHICGQRGYSPFGSEVAKGEEKGDYKEFLMIGREMFPGASKRLGHHLNIWPDFTEIKVPMLRLYNALEDWMIPIEHAIEEALGLKRDFLNKMTFEGDNTLRVSHFPVASHDGTYNEWFATHTDITLFTILPQATDEGLEIEQSDGSWVRAVVPKNAFIVRCGDMLENMTNGYFKSSKQRVLKSSDNKKDRYEMALYVHPRNKDRMDPLPTFITKTGGEELFPKATRLELLMERLADMGSCTDKMLFDLSKSGLIEKLISLGKENQSTLKRLKEAGYYAEELDGSLIAEKTN